MNFSLVFDNSGHEIPFEVKSNHDLIHWFIQKADQEKRNEFLNRDRLGDEIDQRLNELHWAVCKTNEIYGLLNGIPFQQQQDLQQYLDQRFLNQQHADWCQSQRVTVSIDEMRFSDDQRLGRIGWQLHEMLPDEIRHLPMAQAMTKLGYIVPYEEVNMTVHRLEQAFAKDREWSATDKWAGQGLDNPFLDTMVSNMDRVNFSFGYTFVGRQTFDKWRHWDTELEFDDHYNYEKLEWSFQLNLDRPQTLAWSPEFLTWSQQQAVKSVATQIPIANVIDLGQNLTHYRQVLYNNAKQNNAARLHLT